jgi:hypothetical protein
VNQIRDMALFGPGGDRFSPIADKAYYIKGKGDGV